MKVTFRIADDLLANIRRDLSRPHAVAAERVGFIACRPSNVDPDGILIIASKYYPVNENGYLPHEQMGAMMSSETIRSALQIALSTGVSMLHVHAHEHRGVPWFSSVDLAESAKFVPDFFNVAPNVPHGALVLSDDSMAGLCWTAKAKRFSIREASNIGAPLRISRRGG